MKRYFSFLVAIFFAFVVMAQNQIVQSGKFMYKLSGNSAVLVGVAEEGLKDVRIPSSVKINGNKYPITAIADNAFANQSQLLSVSLGINIASVGDNAFVGCTRLKAVYVYSLQAPKCSGKAPVFGSSDGVLPDGLTIYVSAGSIADFQDATMWSELTIEPMITNF